MFVEVWQLTGASKYIFVLYGVQPSKYLAQQLRPTLIISKTDIKNKQIFALFSFHLRPTYKFPPQSLIFAVQLTPT